MIYPSIPPNRVTNSIHATPIPKFHSHSLTSSFVVDVVLIDVGLFWGVGRSVSSFVFVLCLVKGNPTSWIWWSLFVIDLVWICGEKKGYGVRGGYDHDLWWIVKGIGRGTSGRRKRRRRRRRRRSRRKFWCDLFDLLDLFAFVWVAFCGEGKTQKWGSVLQCVQQQKEQKRSRAVVVVMVVVVMVGPLLRLRFPDASPLQRDSLCLLRLLRRRRRQQAFRLLGCILVVFPMPPSSR